MSPQLNSHWNDTTTPSIGKPGAGVTFYRTVVPLDIPAGLDVSLSLMLSIPAGSKLRAQLFVREYQYGRFVPWVGNQIAFPVPPGILDYHGNNTTALAVRLRVKKAQRSILAGKSSICTSLRMTCDLSRLISDRAGIRPDTSTSDL
jgi:hypothetical protein